MSSSRPPSVPEGSPPDPVDLLRNAAPQEDADGNPLDLPLGQDPSKPIGPNNPPRRPSERTGEATRPSRIEVERRIALAQLWIAQRLPMHQIMVNCGENWGITNTKTINRYLNLARERMVQELISDRCRHQAEQIYALNDCARRAMEAEQFNAAVGAFRVIAEIGGLLRAPLKAPEAKP